MSYLGQGLGLGREERFTATATAGQTTVSVGDDGRSISYTPNYVDVYLNGSKQVNGSDITVTSGTSIVFASALTAGDVVDVVAPGYFQPADTVSRSLGGTFLGPVNLPSGGLNVGSGQLRVDSSGRVLTANQVEFQATYASTYTYTVNATNRTPIYGQANRNVGSGYNSANSTFTAPVEGTYLVVVSIGANGTTRASNGFCVVEFLINGVASQQYSSSVNTANVAEGGMIATFIIRLAANDSIRPNLYANPDLPTGGGSLPNWTQTRNYFAGYLLG